MRRIRSIGVAAIMLAVSSTVVNSQPAKERLDEAVQEAKTETVLESIGGPRFLVAQLFTILGTIFGVYLASYVAFQRNLKYDRLVKAQQRSDLLTALREEIKQNIERLRKFNERLPADVGTGVDDKEWPHVRSFVWQATGGSSIALDMPRILMDVQSFYGDINDLLNDVDAHRNFAHLTQSNVYDRDYFKNRLIAQLQFAEATIFPAIDEAMIASGQLLKRYP